ncbi:hypothetical protein [Cohnella zeiphila]|uniref:Uncharacterized protein n=1 Tax=Cohnella zeiphila TaxID=2761120 RepID=A0A7X0SLR8_9BACL|nr:hypothetical protein [Cohnella zeiphila]MBB6730068.1 hypothetical protein [Cohnella zeiphila]
MAMEVYNVRIIARAVVMRYNAGETNVGAVLDSYSLSEEDRTLVLAQIAATNLGNPDGNIVSESPV